MRNHSEEVVEWWAWDGALGQDWNWTAEPFLEMMVARPFAVEGSHVALGTCHSG